MGVSSGSAQLQAPEKLNELHQVNDFSSGIAQLDEWLKRRAMKNEKARASRTYVLCAGRKVVAYYCLSSGAIDQSLSTGRIRRNMPDPIPAMVIGRLAVDINWQGKGIGKAMLQNAVLRILSAVELVGVRAILVHAISKEAKQFYQQYGFSSSPIDSMTLMIRVDDAVASLK